MNLDFQTRGFVPEDRDSFDALYQAVYGKLWRQKTSLPWTVDRGIADAGAFVAIENKKVLAAQPYCDFPLHTQTGSRRATLFLDVATHPDYQRRGLFKGVVAAATSAAFDRGASIIMTTPNQIAFQGFQKIPGWVQLCSLDCMFLPLGLGDSVQPKEFGSLLARSGLAVAALLCRRRTTQRSLSMSHCYVEEPWFPSSDADAMWQRFIPRVGNTIVRSREFLQWRFGIDYRLFLARDQEPAGYIAARAIVRKGLKLGVIVDYMFPTDDSRALMLLRHVIAWLKDQGASAAISYFFRQTVPWKQLRAAGFVCLPRIFTPREYPVCISVRPGDPHSADLLDPSSWHLSLADSDLV